MTSEIYVSTDIEADGPIPGPYSMLSLASAAYRAEKTLVSTFTRNLKTLPGASAHPKTEAWWKTQPEAWAACRRDQEEPALPRRWFDDLPHTHVALDDALGQGALFCNMLREARKA